jgi:energy-converting hydrogenase A subunit M
MATTKKRINISVSKEIDTVLSKLAKRDQVPQATKAEHLIQLALEIEEDQVLDVIARKRDTDKSIFVSHIKAWQ